MLRKIRIAIALFFFLAITLLFLDFTGTVHTYLGWTAKMQFVPAYLAMNFVILLLVLATLLFGRIYCSIICPLGIFQDIVLRLTKKKNRYSYRPPRKALIILRYALLAVFILSVSSGIANGIVGLLDPYSAFARMVSQILGPAYKYANNLLAYFAVRADSYAFYSVDIWLKGTGVLVVAILTFVAVGVCAWKSGRGYCNTICPVGAVLSLAAKYSLIKPRLNASKCSLCGLCAKNCKSSCIDIVIGKIDHFRCVACFNCMSICPKNAIEYTLPLKPKVPFENKIKQIEQESLSEKGLSKRNLLSGSALAVLGSAVELRAHRPAADGGLANLIDKKASKRAKPIIPPGSGSFRNFHDRCTGCQLCVSVCPNNVLRPGFLKPNMSYERGYCRPECVKCSQVCPTGAIRQVTTAEKSSIQIGCAVWRQDLCIVSVDKVNCGNCARHCPTSAISLIPQNADDPASLQIPMIDTDRCIGCGACENLCPARPYSAIHVEGIEVHRDI